MAEIEGNPEVLLLGKDPEAESFWDSLYPRSHRKFEPSSDVDVFNNIARYEDSLPKKTSKRTSHRSSRVYSTKRQRAENRKEEYRTAESTNKCIKVSEQGYEAVDSVAYPLKRRKIDDEIRSVSSLK